MIKKIALVFFSLSLLFADDFSDFESEFSVNDNYNVDYFYDYNKFVTDFNYSAYNMSVRPLNAIYRTVVPKFLRKGVGNFFHNLSSPLRFATLFLSARFKEGFAELGAFVGNTVLGFGGVLRPYRYEKESDFGLMLARWGVPAGEHIVLPFLGPSNIRDALMLPLNYLANPSFYFKNDPYYLAPILETVSKMEKQEFLLDEAYKGLNPYITIRDYYEKNRKALE